MILAQGFLELWKGIKLVEAILDQKKKKEGNSNSRSLKVYFLI